jgi:hypothetical protein
VERKVMAFFVGASAKFSCASCAGGAMEDMRGPYDVRWTNTLAACSAGFNPRRPKPTGGDARGTSGKN